MALEAVTHISDLNILNPPGTDGLNQSDDHLRNIKIALKNDFPNVNGACNPTPAQFNLLASIAALSVLMNATNGAAAPTAIAAASDGQVLRRSGVALAFGAIDSSNPAAVTKPMLTDVRTTNLVLPDTTFIPALTTTLEANSKYAFEAFLVASAPSIDDVKFDLNGPAGYNAFAHMIMNPSTVVYGAPTAGQIIASTTLIPQSSGSGDTFHFIGYVYTAGAAGSFDISAAKQADGGADGSVAIGSWLMMTKLA